MAWCGGEGRPLGGVVERGGGGACLSRSVCSTRSNLSAVSETHVSLAMSIASSATSASLLSELRSGVGREWAGAMDWFN